MPTGKSGDYSRDHTTENYPLQMYLSYANSIGLAIERRCKDYPPRRPADFGRICHQEVNLALHRMRTVSGTMRQMAINRREQNPDI